MNFIKPIDPRGALRYDEVNVINQQISNIIQTFKSPSVTTRSHLGKDCEIRLVFGVLAFLSVFVAYGANILVVGKPAFTLRRTMHYPVFWAVQQASPFQPVV